MSGELIVRHEDARALGWCNRGLRAFARARGIDWSRFLNEGIPAAELARLDDAMVAQVIEQARRRTDGQ